MISRSGSFLAGFEEFKNTKASKKAELLEGKVGLSISIRFVKGYLNKKSLNIILSKGLVDSLKKECPSFKFLYNETENAIAIRYDNSSNAYRLENYTIQKTGIVQIRDKYITYTLTPRLEKEGLSGYKYTGKYFPGESCYIFRINKKLK